MTGCDGGPLGDSSSGSTTDADNTLLERLGERRLLSTLDAALDAALDADGGPLRDYARTLDAGTHTLFAPTDEAFADLGLPTGGALESADAYLDPANADLLAAILRRHTVEGRLDLTDLEDGRSLPTLAGAPLIVRVEERQDGRRLSLGDGALTARVVSDAVEAANGRLVEVDGLLRSGLTSRQRLRAVPLASAFLGALDAADLAGVLDGAHTAVVPLDDGFARLPGGLAGLRAEGDLLRKVLAHHVLAEARGAELAELERSESVATREGTPLAFERRGMLPRVWTAGTETAPAAADSAVGAPGVVRLVATDVRTADGVLHFAARPLTGHLTAWEHLRIDPATRLFRTALANEGLTPLLDDRTEDPVGGPLTVFVPTDAAFEALGSGVAGPLVAGSRPEVLRQVIRFHVGEGAVPSAAFENGLAIPTLEGAPVRVSVDSETSELLLARQAISTPVDKVARNAFMHYVAQTLTPPVNLVDQVFLSGYLQFEQLIAASGLETQLRGKGPFTFVVPDVTAPAIFLDSYACFREEAVLGQVAEGEYPYSPMGVFIETLAGTGIGIGSDGSGGAAASPGGQVHELALEADNGLFYGVERSAWGVPKFPCD